MKYKSLFIALSLCAQSLYAAPDSKEQLRKEIQLLQQQTTALQNQLDHLQKQLVKSNQSNSHKNERTVNKPLPTQAILKNQANPASEKKVHDSKLYVHTLNGDPASVEFYPTALLAEEHHVVTYIAGTPVVTVPYLGSRPAFDGSDYIVNISSINRDVRLMQQRRQLYRAFRTMGYPSPNTPIIALSGKAEPIGSVGNSYNNNVTSDWNLGSAELDASAALNDKVQAYFSLAYDPSPSSFNNQRIANSSIDLGMGFINIGDLDRSPYYFTAGQLYVPFGRFATSMVSAPLTMMMGRTKARPFILGYKSQEETGPFAEIYGFKGDTTFRNSGVGGANWGYVFNTGKAVSEFGASFISSIDNAGGMQVNGSAPTNFGGFGAIPNGNEAVKQIPAIDVHINVRFDRYNLNAEWVSATEPFRTQDLSFNGRGAKPQALHLETAATFMSFSKPSSFAIGYQGSKETLAMRLPEHRISGVYSISIWRDTVESLEYRHDIDFKNNQYANGAAPFGTVNANTMGTGKSSDLVLAQIGVYF